jgi:hypothetical protein
MGVGMERITLSLPAGSATRLDTKFQNLHHLKDIRSGFVADSKPVLGIPDIYTIDLCLINSI